MRHRTDRWIAVLALAPLVACGTAPWNPDFEACLGSPQAMPPQSVQVARIATLRTILTHQVILLVTDCSGGDEPANGRAPADPDPIAACDRAIASGDLSAQSLALGYECRGSWHVASGAYDLALSDFDAAIALDPYFAMSYSDRGVTLVAKGQYQRAIADFNEAIRTQPRLVVAHANRAAAWFAAGNVDRAIVDANDALGFSLKIPAAYANRGLAWFSKGDFDRAIADYNNAIWLDPENSLFYSNRGNAWIKKGDPDRALADFRETVRRRGQRAGRFPGRTPAVAPTLQDVQEQGAPGR